MKKKDYYFLTLYDEGLSKLLDESWQIVTYKKLENGEYNKPGVWALFGKEKKLGKWECLQVGQTNMISKEIKTNVKLMKSKRVELEQPYINQWGEEIFKHPKQFKTSGLWAYIDIPKKYSMRTFVVIKFEDNEGIRKNIEMEYAKQYQAIYFRHGGTIKKYL